MAFVDELKLHIKAGYGGNGVVRWLQEKFRPKGGPSGGNGGKGGDVYAIGVRDIGLLARYKHKTDFVAENGEAGKSKTKSGRDGEDLIIEFPIGTVLTNLDTGKKVELLKEGEKKLLLKGGRGGLGNEHFKASTNTYPTESTPGKPGEEADFYVELELVVDAGLIGFPNAGKSSLLNALTNAQAKVGSYQFTTLDPNLGALYGFVLADIPGLIEGAGEGRGLGHKFLRHIKRTKMLIHCISLEEEDLEKAYSTIRKELKKFDQELIQKEELIVLTKKDTITENELEKAKKAFPQSIAVSILDDESIKYLSDVLTQKLRNLEEKTASASKYNEQSTN